MASLYEIINVEEEFWSFQVPKLLCLGIRRYLERNVADSSLFLCLMRKCLLALVQSYDLDEKSNNRLLGNFYSYLDLPAATDTAKSLQLCPALCDPIPGILQTRLLAPNISLLESLAISKDSPLLYYFYFYYLAHKYLLLHYWWYQTNQGDKTQQKELSGKWGYGGEGIE